MRRILVLFLAAMFALPAIAQREFLTNDEIEKIREAQDPNLRLKMYLLFAKQRLDQLQQQIAKDKKGRSLAVRQLLEDYQQIIDAIDTVSDDALKRKVDVALGVNEVAGTEKTFLAQLRKIEESQPHDLDMYEVSLKDAIETTSDSIDAAGEDLGKRTEAVTAKAEEEKKKIESLSTPEQLKEKKKEEAKAEIGTPKRKPPTLYRPGEKPDQPKP
jgi:predicted transcriptional regulator